MPERFSAFVDRRGDRAAETVWLAAMAVLERAVDDAREGRFGRWRMNPRGEMRRLRRDLAEGLELARLAVTLQEEYDGQTRELTAELTAQAAAAGTARRRAQTLPAERVRLANAASRRAAGHGGKRGAGGP